ncbi:transketolase [Sphingomicrobium astaxanthinifaciens]|uniref:transketolase n=1 Tax=Sphingomicrobium astaxanthinifaciens TaxID=1227949 RepID=UPI001FCAE1E9|nr:transketolase [Sphingomicrobium astaxanthinifaciens]MCJ7420770.1 transketolase [Sphingomicrobium astaxanthinifaciens]
MTTDLAALDALDSRLRWLASWTIHHANHVRPKADGVKVGGHQASSASISAIMAALYFHALGPNDRVAVKPHAGPVLHAIHYLLGTQTRHQLENFRGLGGAQSYPSRTKDAIPVDFSTGSVGLGVAITLFSSLVQDYLHAHGRIDAAERGRFVALIGDAELDEGNIYEAIIEGAKHDVRGLWWIVDYNRQSLDATSADRMFERFDDIFSACGWRTVELRFGKKLEKALGGKGGKAVRDWLEALPNADFAALHYQGGAAWRARLEADLGKAAAPFLAAHRDDAALGTLMTDLGGHCMETLVEAFDAAKRDDTPTFFIAWTVKGFGLPFAGHKDNHAGLMNPTQVAAWRDELGIAPGEEWEPLAGLSGNMRPKVEALLEATRIRRDKRARSFGSVPIPDLPAPEGEEQSTQAAFGRLLMELSKRGGELADRIVTTSPDVTVSTNLGGWVNSRGLFKRRAMEDVFAKAKIPSAQKWAGDEAGQHIELGIAESNLFLMLAAAGLAGDHWQERLFPIGTLYDPFIARGLDSLNYGCYQDARFLLVATPSGLTLGPEGGAHQSINPPLIALGQPGLRHYEPAFADELAAMMEEAFRLIDDPDGESTYLRLSTRPVAQVTRADADEDWKAGALAGGYWLKPPAEGAEAAIVAMGALMPEALAAHAELSADIPGLGLLAVTSPDLLHRGWTAAQAARWAGNRAPSHVETLLGRLAPGAGLVTLCDAAPASLSWLGGVCGQRVAPLGVERFGQTGNLADLYATYRLDARAITEAMAEILLTRS